VMCLRWQQAPVQRTRGQLAPSTFRSMRAIAVACGACCVAIGPASAAPVPAADPPSKTTTAVRITAGLTDEVWRAAPPTSGFLQREPKEGAEPAQRTEFRV